LNNRKQAKEIKAMTIATEQAKSKATIWTDEEFMALPDHGDRYEIIDGELVTLGNSGMEHGNIGIFLGGLIEIFVRQHRLGVTCDSSTAFKMKGGNKRSPDISFVSRDKLQGLAELPDGFLDGAPDLAIEVLSPNNTIAEIDQKIVEYFENGSRLVWVINLKLHYVLVYRSALEPDRLLKQSDSLDGEDVIAGFTMPLFELFQRISF
jgi:Uma2 family endonuclease